MGSHRGVQNLVRYVPIWDQYVREFLLQSVADGVSYVEVRINFLFRYVVAVDMLVWLCETVIKVHVRHGRARDSPSSRLAHRLRSRCERSESPLQDFGP
jgi:histone deacetylase complex regulatory component SIN3